MPPPHWWVSHASEDCHGKMTVVESDPSDNRRTRDMIVVEDVPEAIARIASYIEQVDCPPRQVLI